MFVAVVAVVALAADPVVFWLRVGISAATRGHGPNVVADPHVPITW